MNKRLLGKAFLAAVLCGSMMGSFSACPKEGTVTKRDTNPHEVNPETVVYQVKLNWKCGDAVAPCTVNIEARNVLNPKEAEILDFPVARGSGGTTLDYNKGRRVQITMTLKASRVGKVSDAYVEIIDGPMHTATEPLLGFTARAQLTTNRG